MRSGGSRLLRSSLRSQRSPAPKSSGWAETDLTALGFGPRRGHCRPGRIAALPACRLENPRNLAPSPKRLARGLQSKVQDLLHMAYEVNLHPARRVGGDLAHVLLVQPGQDD